jgi:hypothetical protein
MKSISTDAWLVNFILSFSGLSPILIRPKVNFFKLTWHTRPQQCAHLLDSNNQNGLDLIKFHPKKLQLGPTKSFSGYVNSANLQEQIWAQPSYKRAKLVLWCIRFVTIGCHIGCHIRFCPAWQSRRTELMRHRIDDFPCVIKLMIPRNKVLSLIAVCDARLKVIAGEAYRCGEDK